MNNFKRKSPWVKVSLESNEPTVVNPLDNWLQDCILDTYTTGGNVSVESWASLLKLGKKALFSLVVKNPHLLAAILAVCYKCIATQSSGPMTHFLRERLSEDSDRLALAEMLSQTVKAILADAGVTEVNDIPNTTFRGIPSELLTRPEHRNREIQAIHERFKQMGPLSKKSRQEVKLLIQTLATKVGNDTVG